MSKVEDFMGHCWDCGVRTEKCDCGGEGRTGQAKVKADHDKMKGNKKK